MSARRIPQKVAGVLGGMGPDATVDFMAKVIALTPAGRDQDHVRMLVDHNPQVPNRQGAILAGGDDPAPVLAEMAVRLEAAGADFLVMPCNTAHVFAETISAAVRIPLVSIIDVTLDTLMDVAPGARRVGVLATDGCLGSGIFQDALAAAGLSPVLPEPGEIDRAMQLIARVKAGDRGADVSRGLAELGRRLIGRGAEAIILGCTEIPLVLRDGALDVPLIASTDALAARTVAIARGD